MLCTYLEGTLSINTAASALKLEWQYIEASSDAFDRYAMAWRGFPRDSKAQRHTARSQTSENRSPPYAITAEPPIMCAAAGYSCIHRTTIAKYTPSTRRRDTD